MNSERLPSLVYRASYSYSSRKGESVLVSPKRESSLKAFNTIPSPPTTRRARSKAAATYRKDHQDKDKDNKTTQLRFPPRLVSHQRFPAHCPFPVS